MSRVWLVLLCCSGLLASAQTPQPTSVDPVANKRAVALSEELRCLVCQNQSIAESNAELAVDLRRQIREQIDAGRDDKQIIAYMVERYGDFVLYRPPLKASTLLLWLGPPVLFLVCLALLLRYLRQRRHAAAPQPLSDEERRRAAAMLNEGKGNGS
mgnify:CR=1 FL=1